MSEWVDESMTETEVDEAVADAARKVRGDRLQSLADRVSERYMSGTSTDEFDPEGEGREDIERMQAEQSSGVNWETLLEFKRAARALKAAESAYRDAQQAYGEAVKRLSEEAVK